MQTWRGIVAQIERVATRRGRSRVECFALEGFRLHERALRAGMPPEDTLLAASLHRDSRLRTRRLLEELEAAGCRLHVAPDGVLERLTGGRGLGPLIGLKRMPPPASLRHELGSDPNDPVIALVALDVADPGNAGALVRTAHALGVRVLVAVGSSDPYHPRAVRTSMGSVFRCAIARYRDAAGAFDDLGRCQVRTIAAVSRGGASPEELSLATRRVALVIGNEAHGLPAATCERIELQLAVPMVRDVDSLSANAAAAILLHELRSRLAGVASAPACEGRAGALRFGPPTKEEERAPCLASRTG